MACGSCMSLNCQTDDCRLDDEWHYRRRHLHKLDTLCFDREEVSEFPPQYQQPRLFAHLSEKKLVFLPLCRKEGSPTHDHVLQCIAMDQPHPRLVHPDPPSPPAGWTSWVCDRRIPV